MRWYRWSIKISLVIPLALITTESIIITDGQSNNDHSYSTIMNIGTWSLTKNYTYYPWSIMTTHDKATMTTNGQ